MIPIQNKYENARRILLDEHCGKCAYADKDVYVGYYRCGLLKEEPGRSKYVTNKYWCNLFAKEKPNGN